jgi:hypothetical protein
MFLQCPRLVHEALAEAEALRKEGVL